MIIYLYLFIPSLFLSVESSSIRGRNNKNELVPLMSSRLDNLEKDNNLKVVSREPFIIQLHVPKHNDSKSERDKKRKRPAKKRISKLRKKHRTRRDLMSSRLKYNREEKFQPTEIPLPVNTTEEQGNTTKNSINRIEILKALSSYPRKKQTKRSHPEGLGEADDTQKPKHTLSPLDKSPIVKMIYPSTPKLDRHSHKYTYRDLLADRKRLEQKINYIKNMFSANDTATDDAVRIRRRSESDKTANKIAKMFLTLSAVNGLQDKRRTRCKEDDDDDGDRVQDIWETEQRSSPNRKASSSNAERYKVKKWIEFMKNKRSSGKTCPCMTSVHGDDSDAFPLEQKLPKDYFLMERSRSSEESGETYNSRDRPYRRRYNKDGQENKLKALGKNGKKKLDLPLSDLELYRSRAKQILRNAEDILDRIKEEEEKRLSAPSILMSQLKELTSRIQSDPRNNENDLIRKMQKSLGWKPMTKSQESSDGNPLIDSVKSIILDPYEKAKELTDESTKMLSTYLLRNLGRMQESSEEEESARQGDDVTGDKNEAPQVYFGEVPTKEEKPSSANLAKEDSQPDLLSKTKEELQNWEDTISTIMQGADDAVQKPPSSMPEEVFKNRMEDIIKEQQKKLNDYEANPHSDENTGEENRSAKGKKTKPDKHTEGDKYPLRFKLKNENDKDKLKNLKGSKAPKPEDKLKLKPKNGKVEDKPMGDTKGSEELEKAIFEVVKTLQNDKTPVEEDDPQLQQNSEEPKEENDEEEVRSSNETPLQISLNKEDEKVEISEPRTMVDYDFLPEDEINAKEAVREDLNEPTNEESLVQTPEIKDLENKSNMEEAFDPLLRKAEQLETDLTEKESENKSGEDNPKAEQLESELTGEENKSAEDNLEEVIDPLLQMAQRLENELNEEEPDMGSKSAEDAVQETSTGSKPKDDKPDSSQSDEDKDETDLLNLKLERQDAPEKVKAVLNQKDEESSEEVGRSESEDDDDDDSPVKASLKSSKERPDEVKEDSPETDDVPLKAAKSDSEETPLKEALEKVEDDDGSSLRENEDDDDSLLEKALKKEDTPTRKTLESEEDKENDEESRLRKALDKEKEEKYDNPLRKSLGDTVDKDEIPLRKNLESNEDENDSDDDTDSTLGNKENKGEETPLRKTQESKEDEDDDDDDDSPLRKTLDSKEDVDDSDDDSPLTEAVKKEEDKYEDPLLKNFGNKRDDIPLKKTLESKEDEDQEDDSPLREALNKPEEKEDEQDDTETPLRKTLQSKEDEDENEDDDPLRETLKEREEDDTPLRKSLEEKKDDEDNDDETPLKNALESKEDEEDENDDEDSPLRQSLKKPKNKYDTPLRKGLKKQKDKPDTPLRRKLGKKKDKQDNEDDETPLRKSSKEDEGDENDDDSPLREGPKKQKDKHVTPLRKSLGKKKEKDNEDDETPLRKTLESKEDDDDDEEDSPLKKQKHKYDNPLRKSLGKKKDKDNEDDETPLRKTLESKEDDDEKVDDDDDEEDSPLKKQKHKYDNPLRKSLGKKKDKDNEDDETPLRETLESKEDEGDESDEDSPLREGPKKQKHKYVTPLRKSLGKKKDKEDENDEDSETPLRKTLESEEDEKDEDSPLREALKEREETPLRKTLESKENEDEKVDDDDDSPLRGDLKKQKHKYDTPLRKSLGKKKDKEDEDDEDSETPLRKTLETKEDEKDDEDSPLRETLKEREETPLRKTLESTEDEVEKLDDDDDSPLREGPKKQKHKYDTPLRKSLGKKKDDEDSETPLRKTLESKEDEKDDEDSPLREALKEREEETPLRKSLKSKEDERDSDEESPLKNALNQQEDDPLGNLESAEEKDEIPLRKTLNSKEDDGDDDDEVPLRKSFENRENTEDETPLRKTLDDKEDEVDGDDETPLRKTLDDDDGEAPLRKSFENEDEMPLRKAFEDDEAPLKKTLQSKEDDVDNDESPLKKTFESKENTEDETPLRQTQQSKENEDEETPLRKSFDSKEDSDETPLREALESEEKDETLQAENPMEESDKRPTSKEDNNDQAIREPNTQGTSASEEDETTLKESLKQNLDPDSYRTVSSEEDKSEQNELQDARSDGPLQSIFKELESNLDTANSDENDLQSVNQDTQNSEEIKSSREQDEQTVKSEHPIQQKEDNETSGEVLNTQDKINPEVDGQSLLKSAENTDIDAGDNLRAEKPEQTSEEMRSIPDNESLENVLETTNDETSLKEAKPDSQSEENSDEVMENLAEDMREVNEDESSLKAERPLAQDEDGSDENVQATLNNVTSEEDDGTPVRATLEGSNQDEDVQPEDTPLRLSLNEDQEDRKTDNSEEDTLRNASLENELDSDIKDVPLQSAKTLESSEEAVRAEDNQIDEAEDETPLRSAKFDESNEDDSTGNSEETLRAAKPLGEELISDLIEEHDPEGNDQVESRESSAPNFLQMSPKTGKLQVPKSIGQIMKDLDGRQKEDITSVKNLNPEKIDDIIDKIDEAEQQNLLEHPEVDCRKECACADEIESRSRNIGRFEIVKDFLHWMKDLQLNRVLTDD